MEYSLRARLVLPALFGRSLLMFPVWMLVLSLEKSVPVMPCCLVLVVFGFLDSILVRVLGNRFSGRLMPAAGVLLGFGLCAVVFWRMMGGIWVALLLAGLGSFSACAGVGAEADMLFRPNGYAAFLTGMVLLPPVLRTAGFVVESGWVLGITAAESILFLFLRNRFMLFRLVNRRSAAETAVPAHIRRGNLLMFGGVVVFLAAVMLFHAPVAAGLRACGRFLLGALSAVVSVLARFANWIAGNAPDALSQLPESDPQELVRGTRSPLWNLLWVPLGLVTLYFVRVFFWEWLCEFVDMVRDFFVRLTRLRGENRRVRADSGEYEDIETSVESKKTAAQEKRGWKKAYRAWQAQADTQEKFYAGYALLLRAPGWEPKVRDSETVQEIRAHWADTHSGEDTLAGVTAVFHADRYAGEGLPENALAEMKAALHTVYKDK